MVRSAKNPRKKGPVCTPEPSLPEQNIAPGAGPPAVVRPDPPGIREEDRPAARQILQWLLEGHRDDDITEAAAAQYPDADAGALIAATLDYLSRISDADPRVIRGWCFEATRDLYRRLLEAGDYVGALRAVKELGAMAGRNV